MHFYGVLGKESRAPDIPSYYNMAEAAEISERVEELVRKWSDEYGDGCVEENICVLAPYTAQVRVTHFVPRSEKSSSKHSSSQEQKMVQLQYGK